MRTWSVEVFSTYVNGRHVVKQRVIRNDGEIYATCDTHAQAANVCTALNWKEKDDLNPPSPEKHGYEVAISFPGNSWRSVVMLTTEESQRLIDLMLALELDGKIRKDAWFVYAKSSLYTFDDIKLFLRDNTEVR